MSKSIASIVVMIIGLISALGYVTFYLNTMNQVNRMIQGDPNAKQEFGESVKDEVESEVKWTVTKALIITVASAFGLTGLIKILKKL
jgi:hypothetical protein